MAKPERLGSNYNKARNPQNTAGGAKPPTERFSRAMREKEGSHWAAASEEPRPSVSHCGWARLWAMRAGALGRRWPAGISGLGRSWLSSQQLGAQQPTARSPRGTQRLVRSRPAGAGVADPLRVRSPRFAGAGIQDMAPHCGREAAASRIKVIRSCTTGTK